MRVGKKIENHIFADVYCRAGAPTTKGNRRNLVPFFVVIIYGSSVLVFLSFQTYINVPMHANRARSAGQSPQRA